MKETGWFCSVMFANRRKGDNVEYAEFRDEQVNGFYAECGMRLNEIRAKIIITRIFQVVTFI